MHYKLWVICNIYKNYNFFFLVINIPIRFNLQCSWDHINQCQNEKINGVGTLPIIVH